MVNTTVTPIHRICIVSLKLNHCSYYQDNNITHYYGALLHATENHNFLLIGCQEMITYIIIDMGFLVDKNNFDYITCISMKYH